MKGAQFDANAEVRNCETTRKIKEREKFTVMRFTGQNFYT